MILPSKNILKSITARPTFYFRIVLFFAFVGHGLVSLGLSPSYELHLGILNSVNFTSFNSENILFFQGILDIVIGLLLLFNIFPLYTLTYSLIYLVSVGASGIFFFYAKTDSVFGIAEFMRRVPWMFIVVFLLYAHVKNRTRLNLIRWGISFAFLAHGLASIGFFGLKGGHIELATNIVSQEAAQNFVFYSGISDTLIGICLLTGIFSRLIAYPAVVWILFIVILSFMTSFADGLFRIGFLLSSLYVSIDAECHTKPIFRF